MVNNICEQVPENGYGYSQAKYGPIQNPCSDQKTEDQENHGNELPW